MSVPSVLQLRLMSNLLHAGGVIAYPTEGVFGLGCDPRNETAVQRILRIKGRSADKGLILIGADETQLWQYARIVDEARMRKVRETWPGPVTWIFPARDDVSPLITGGRKSVAIRVTSHPGAAALCAVFGGALVSTSANLAGERPARSRLRVRQRLGERVDCIAPGRVGSRRIPSAIRDVANAKTIRGELKYG